MLWILLYVQTCCNDGVKYQIYIFKYLEGLIECMPDLYLSELQEYLLEGRGVDVSQATIQRTLHCRGFM